MYAADSAPAPAAHRDRQQRRRDPGRDRDQDDRRPGDDPGQVAERPPHAVGRPGSGQADRRRPRAAHDRQRRDQSGQSTPSGRRRQQRLAQGRAIPSVHARERYGGVDADRLERSCSRRHDSIRFGARAPGLERAEVYLCACAFEPHRHDSYAIGITTAGVQTFRYRGIRRVCLPGQLHVLHPDETHDGAAGTDDGFGYRILYVAPELVRDALGGGPLPFVADPVQTPTPATRLVASLLADIDEPISDLARAEIAATLADALRALGGRPTGGPATDRPRAVELRPRLPRRPRGRADAGLDPRGGSPGPTASRSPATSGGPSEPAPTATGRLRRLGLARAAIERGRTARPGRRRRRLRRPEPHDPPVQAGLRPDAGPLDGPHRRAMTSADRSQPAGDPAAGGDTGSERGGRPSDRRGTGRGDGGGVRRGGPRSATPRGAGAFGLRPWRRWG